MSIRLLKYLTPVIQPLYRKYLSKTRKFRYRNIRILVKPGVFHPGLFFSTKLFLRFIGHFDLSGKTFLELGAGSGIISLYAASRGAAVIASDINPVAVSGIRENALMNKIAITVIESDMFEKIPKTEFDYIIIAPPYYAKDPVDYAEMAWYCGRDFEYYKKLFQQLPDFYHKSSRVLMILSEDCNIPEIKGIGAGNGFQFRLLYEKRRMGEWNYIFGIERNDDKKYIF